MGLHLEDARGLRAGGCSTQRPARSFRGRTRSDRLYGACVGQLAAGGICPLIQLRGRGCLGVRTWASNIFCQASDIFLCFDVRGTSAPQGQTEAPTRGQAVSLSSMHPTSIPCILLEVVRVILEILPSRICPSLRRSIYIYLELPCSTSGAVLCRVGRWCMFCSCIAKHRYVWV